MIDHNRGLDNFVPPIGLLSTTRVRPVVLIGIWMIFLPATIVAAVAVAANWITSADPFSAFMSATVPLFLVAIGTVILYQTTRRYLREHHFGRPTQAERSLVRAATISGWWVAVPYITPLVIMLTAMSEAGWYGTGTSGWLLGMTRIILFFIGIGCACYALIFGSTFQRLASAPMALGYTALLIGMLVDYYL